jgi:hypothetical protein
MRLFLFLVIVLLITGSAKAQQDTIAIKSLLQQEAATWRAGDIKGHADCWSIRPYSRILVSTPDGNCYDVPPAAIVNPSPEMMDKGGKAILSGFKFSINGNTAWVSHEEESIAEDGTKNYSHEIRLLEKIKGKWKLVGQSIHLYKPA